MSERERDQSPQCSQGDSAGDVESTLTTEYWDYVEKLNRDTLECAKKTFSFSYYVNWVIVLLGVGLFLISFNDIIRTGAELENTILGVVGVGTVVTIFLVSPQNRIANAIGDFLQVQMYHRTYEALFRFVTDWKYVHDYHLQIEDLAYVVDILVENTLRLSSTLETALGEVELVALGIKSTALTVEPAEVEKGEKIKVAVTVMNEGPRAGDKTIEVKFDESADVVVSKKVTLEGKASRTVSFEIATDNLEIGTHTARVDDLKMQFNVKEPKEPEEPEEPTEPIGPEEPTGPE